MTAFLRNCIINKITRCQFKSEKHVNPAGGEVFLSAHTSLLSKLIQHRQLILTSFTEQIKSDFENSPRYQQIWACQAMLGDFQLSTIFNFMPRERPSIRKLAPLPEYRHDTNLLYFDLYLNATYTCSTQSLLLYAHFTVESLYKLVSTCRTCQLCQNKDIRLNIR